MRVVSVNVGEARLVQWRGRPVSTAIFKEPVEGPRNVRLLGLAGDHQADLSVHGGVDKAVYAYPAEHYGFWQEELDRELSWASFGENLTVEGLPLEQELCIGDRLCVGGAELAVTQPRLPCFKLGIRFGDARMVKRFLAAGRTGYYLRVLVEGQVRAGDDIAFVARDPGAVPVSEVTRVYAHARDDAEALRRLLGSEALPDDWRPLLTDLLAKAEAGSASRS